MKIITPSNKINIEKMILLWIRDNEKFVTSILILLNFLPIIISLVYLSKYGYNLPNWDQFAHEIPKIIKFHEQSLSLNDFLVLHNDLRPIVTSIILFITTYLSGWNFLAESYVAFFFLFLSYLIVFLIVSIQYKFNNYVLLLLIPFSWYFFNLTLLSGYLWGLSIYYSVCLFFAILSLFYILKSNKFDRFFIYSILCVEIATFSFTSGLFLWPTVFLILFFEKGKPYNKLKLIVWLLFFIFTVIWNYLIMGFTTTGLHGYSGYKMFITTFIQYPLQKIACIFGSIGSTIIIDPSAAIFGIILVLLLGVNFILTKNSKGFKCSKIWYGLIFYSLLSGVFIAITRSGQGVDFGSADQYIFNAAPRHLTSIFFIPIGIYLVYLNSLMFHLKEKEKILKFDTTFLTKLCIYSYTLGLVAALLIVSCTFGFVKGPIEGNILHDRLQENEKIILSYENQSDEQLINVYPDKEYAKYILGQMEKYNITPFHKKQIQV